MNDHTNYEAFKWNDWKLEEYLRSEGALKDHEQDSYYIYLKNSEKWSCNGGGRVVQVFISLKTWDVVAMAQLNRVNLREILIMKEIR
jgi:hypothetical protein